MGKRNSWGGTILSIYDANESLVTLEDALKKAEEAVKADSAMSIAKAMTGGLGLYFGPGADMANAQAILDKVPEYVKFVGLDRRRSEAEATANKLGGGIDRVLIKLGGLTEAELKNWSVDDKIAKLEELCSKASTKKSTAADPADLKAAKDEAKRIQKDLEAKEKQLDEAEAAKVASDSTIKELQHEIKLLKVQKEAAEKRAEAAEEKVLQHHKQVQQYTAPMTPTATPTPTNPTPTPNPAGLYGYTVDPYGHPVMTGMFTKDGRMIPPEYVGVAQYCTDVKPSAVIQKPDGSYSKISLKDFNDDPDKIFG
jgi:hypothetical protein